MQTKNRPTLNPCLRPFWQQPARIKVLYGGRISSKSWDAAGFAIFLSTQVNIRVLCARQFQNKIADSVYTLLKVQIERFGLSEQFHITESNIRNIKTGSEFIFKGLWRHIDEIKSLEGIDICWIEEAHNLTKDQWEVLEPTVRKEGSEFWIIFNPKLANDFTYTKFVTGTPSISLGNKIFGIKGRAIKRMINYDENPFLSNTSRQNIEDAKAANLTDYEHIYKGVPKTDDMGAIISRSWVMAAIDAHKALCIDPIGSHRIGFDPADGSDDPDAHDANALVHAHGFLTVGIQEWKAGKDGLMKSAARVFNLARTVGAEIEYDSIGVGASAGAHFSAFNAEHKTRIQYEGFNAADGVVDPHGAVHQGDPNSPKNRDHFSNLKAQRWQQVADDFLHTYNAVKNGHDYDLNRIIAISSDCDHVETLIDELCAPMSQLDNLGRMKVESKKDMKKRGIASPNVADAFIMSRKMLRVAYGRPVVSGY